MRLMGLLFRQFYHYADISRLVKLYVSHTQQHLEYAQSGIRPQLRTMLLLRMCKGLPVEYLPKCGTVNVLRCWTLWTSPAWKPVLKLSLLYTIVNNLAVFPEASNLSCCVVCYPYSTHLYAWIVICNLLWVYIHPSMFTLTSLILLIYGRA